MKLFIKPFVNYAIFLMLVAGCVSPEPESYRISRYRPDVASIPAPENSDVLKTAAVANESSTDSISGSGKAKNQGVASTEQRAHSKLRTLKSGDNIIIHLRSIPVPDEIKEVIDGWGEVTIPHIGEVRLAGKTVSEAERLIESSYIDGGIFKKINVIVVAEDEVYFVRGEVTRRGKYSLSGEVTLLQAISESGGYTPFANIKKIKVMRGDKVLTYNGREIARGKIPDPPIYSNDIIEVQRRVIW